MDLKKKTVGELRSIARSKNIPLSSQRMLKKDLIEAIQSHERQQNLRWRQKRQPRRRCIVVTCVGRRCLRYCPDTEVRCKMHQKQCQAATKQYHQICDMVWKVRCKGQKHLSVVQRKRISVLADLCARLRMYFAMECCNDLIDDEHYGAIRKMKRLSKECVSGIETRKKSK